MLLLLEIGRRVRVKRRPKESEGEQSGLSSVEGAVFALFGLMMGVHLFRSSVAPCRETDVDRR